MTTPEQISEAKKDWIETTIKSVDWKLIREKRLLYEKLSGEKTDTDSKDNILSFGEIRSTIQPAD